VTHHARQQVNSSRSISWRSERAEENACSSSARIIRRFGDDRRAVVVPSEGQGWLLRPNASRWPTQ
jgi:hypothetical protein